jgi:hypothetical protein
LRTKKRSERPLTINLVGCDPFLCERIRASLGRSPFHFQPTAEPLADDDVDIFVVPALQVGDLADGGVPVIAYGPAGLLRAAFLAGCVDYLRDPWTPEELALRAQSALSRRSGCWDFPWGEARFEGDTLCTPGGSAPFPHSEAVLLRALLRRRGQPVPRVALASLLGAAARKAGSRSVDVHLSAVRRRVRSVAPEAGPFIVCVRGKGYMVP